MQRLQKLLTKSPKLVVGLLSGTSLDGVDAAVVNIKGNGLDTEIELVHFLTIPFPTDLTERILRCSSPGQGRVDEICQLNFLLGEVFADAVRSLLSEAGLELGAIDLIGSHGQTVQHIPDELSYRNYKIRSTLQLGEPSVIAKRTGVLTVADFRPADMALGGQGAPLVPYFDYVMFADAGKSRGLLNIGGISNLTILKRNCRLEEISAFDCGPGNMIVDGLMRKLYGQPYDQDGRTAQSGQASDPLLKIGLRHPYFSKPAPKSTGREMFGAAYRDEFLSEAQKLSLGPQDVIASATELTTRSIFECYQKFVAPEVVIDELIVSGGGARNGYMMDSLAKKFHPIPVKSIDQFGIPAEAKEAICFAVLANETVSGVPSNVPAATGAAHPTILGKLCF